jgi:hypothetical protein
MIVNKKKLNLKKNFIEGISNQETIRDFNLV